MTRSKQRKLLQQQQKAAMQQANPSPNVQSIEPEEKWPDPYYSLYFLAVFEEDFEDQNGPPSWNLYRLVDFVTPAALTQPIWSCPEEDFDQMKTLMLRLDKLQPAIVPGVKEQSSKQEEDAM